MTTTARSVPSCKRDITQETPPPPNELAPPPQAHGGQRLLGCLTKLKAVGVAVVVSRVYGGQHLGKARSIGPGCGEPSSTQPSSTPDRRASSTSVLPRASYSRRSAISPGPASSMRGEADRCSAAPPLQSRWQRPTARPRPHPAARGSERAWPQQRRRRRRRRPSAPCSRWRQSADCPLVARRAHHRAQLGCGSRPCLSSWADAVR